MSNQIAIQNAYDPVYPAQPGYNPNCGINEIYQTIPSSSPHNRTNWEHTAVGPSSIKHLYTGIPNWYPIRKITRPVGTLYEHDYSQFHETGVGKGKRISYQYKPYPLTDINVREVHEYADYMLPYMDFRAWTKYPVRRDASVNSPLQTYPQAYIPDRTSH
uniref:Uncharacterized protein n=1 Tax=Pithovirus LCDPAC01 TaxID=2506600 RepID=A0A4D5XFN1_9VIRU|nr:MAG: uncharacterized protein LCDPAC01_02730 [Pithovirus LCDPAC01]